MVHGLPCTCTGCGVFILSIEDNPAKASRILQAGDEIISVNGSSLINCSYLECVKTLRTVHGDSILTIRRNEDLMKHVSSFVMYMYMYIAPTDLHYIIITDTSRRW